MTVRGVDTSAESLASEVVHAKASDFASMGDASDAVSRGLVGEAPGATAALSGAVPAAARKAPAARPASAATAWKAARPAGRQVSAAAGAARTTASEASGGGQGRGESVAEGAAVHARGASSAGMAAVPALGKGVAAVRPRRAGGARRISTRVRTRVGRMASGGGRAASASAAWASSARATAAAAAPARVSATAAAASTTGGTAVLAAVAGIVLLVLGLFIVAVQNAGEVGGSGGSGAALAAIAVRESQLPKVPHETAEVGDDNVVKYTTWAGMDGSPWCAIFVSWCANEAGMLGQGRTFDHVNASAIAFASDPSVCPGSYVRHLPSLGGYVPQPGDLVCSDAHVAVVVAVDEATGDIDTVGGNESGTVTYRKARYNFLRGQWGGMTELVSPNYPSAEGDGTKSQLFAGTVDWSLPEDAFVEKWGSAIDRWYAQYQGSPPLTGSGRDYARSAYRHKLDPRYLPVVSVNESGGGRHCFHAYNAWGYGQMSFASWAQGIERVASCVADPGGPYAGCGTVEEIQAIYSPPSENDTAAYIASNKRLAAQITALAG